MICPTCGTVSAPHDAHGCLCSYCIDCIRKHRTMEKAYTELDKEGVGYFTYEGLADKFIDLGVSFSKEDLVSLAEDIDTDNDRKISKVGTGPG